MCSLRVSHAPVVHGRRVCCSRAAHVLLACFARALRAARMLCACFAHAMRVGSNFVSVGCLFMLYVQVFYLLCMFILQACCLRMLILCIGLAEHLCCMCGDLFVIR